MPSGYMGWEHGSDTGYAHGCRCGLCKTGRNRRQREYRAARRDHINELQRAQYRREKEKRLAKEKLRYQRDKERICARVKAHGEPNLDPVKKKDRQRRNNKAKRARKKNAFVETVDHKVVFERSEGICGICHMPVEETDFHVDHIIPLSRGGEHSYVNVQAAHPFCNISKGNKIEGGAEGCASSRCEPLTA